MPPIILAAQRTTERPIRYARRLGWAKLILAALFASLALAGPELRHAMATAMSEAYLQVSVFVAATLAIVYGLQNWAGVDIRAAMAKRPGWQPIYASVMGAIPGCGGAVAVVTQYASGHLTFGSLIAVLTATMGDAAFLLLAAEPQTGLMVFAISAVIGAGTGALVDATHGRNFMRAKSPELAKAMIDTGENRLNPVQPLWLIIFAPGLILGALSLAQVDTDTVIFGPLAAYQPTHTIGLVGCVLSISMWLFDPVQRFDPGVARGGGVVTRTVNTTNFITIWVVLAFVSFEAFVTLTGIDLAQAFATIAALLPVIAVLVGFLPGCGPQLVITTMYIEGQLPLSAQLGNAISNDGDALFPTIALAPRAAIIATLYSAIPALLAAYGYFWLFERG